MLGRMAHSDEIKFLDSRGTTSVGVQMLRVPQCFVAPEGASKERGQSIAVGLKQLMWPGSQIHDVIAALHLLSTRRNLGLSVIRWEVALSPWN